MRGQVHLARGVQGATAILLPLVLGAVLMACEKQVEDTEPLIRPVRYQEVVKKAPERVRTFSGTTKAELESTLSFKVSGTLTSRPVSVGDLVNAGQVIARLNPQDYQVVVYEAEAELAAARAELRNAEANYERVRGLYENRNASKSDLDAARAAAESGTAQVRAARQQLEAARLQLSYTNLTSPQDCTIAETSVKENENVSAGEAVVRVNCGECSEVTVSVPETFIGGVQAGDPVEVMIDALRGQAYAASVTEVGVTSAQAGTTFSVTVALTHNCPNVRSGMAADVRFTFVSEGGEDRIFAPGVAVGEDRSGRYVFILSPAGGGYWTANRRSVEIGAIYPGSIEVKSGLEEGELVVTAGVTRITDGQRVSLLDDT